MSIGNTLTTTKIMNDKEQLIKNLNELLDMAQAKLNLQQSKLDKHLASVQDFNCEEQATAWDNQKERLRIKFLNWVSIVVWLTQEINELEEYEDKAEGVDMLLARDKNGMLGLFFGTPPTKDEDEGYWDYGEDYSFVCINESWFPQVKWEDKEPTKVKLVIIK